MHMSVEAAASVAARAALAGARGRHGGRAQTQVVEGAVQLATDLVEHLLAGDQIVCGHRVVTRSGSTALVAILTRMQTRAPGGMTGDRNSISYSFRRLLPT